MLINSSSGSLKPLSTGYLTSKQSQVSPCSSHSLTPHSARRWSSTLYWLGMSLTEIWQGPSWPFSSTGGAL